MNNIEKRKWYLESTQEIEESLGTSIEQGLSNSEVQLRIEKHGSNEITTEGKNSILSMFLSQFKDFMIIVLIAAAIISFIASHELAEPIIILLIVLLNAIIGVVQENNAEKSLAALKKMSSPSTKVRRDGQDIEVPSTNLVPGDIVIIETGDLITADLKLFETINLKVQESALTGESVPVDKDAGITFNENTDSETPLGDRINMAYSSCLVTYGRGRGIVVETGMSTEVGKIANMLLSVENRETPLQRKLNHLGKQLGIAALLICVIMFGIGIANGKGLLEMFMTSVSLAVAAIPEGLPAISTIVLAIGVKKMVEKNAIMRNLPSVETLGSTSVICSDKTGTLTQNKMTVTKLWSENKLIDATIDSNTITENDNFRLLALTSILCNDSKISDNEEGHKTIGDPTETALIELGLNVGMDKRELDKLHARVYEFPFDSERKLMSVVCKTDDNKLILYTKGAIDVLTSRCNLDENTKNEIFQAHEEMAQMALKVLGMAYKVIDAVPENNDNLEENLNFIGLIGMIDPPRIEAKEAVQKCKAAGIKPIMITGDHKTTAIAIARELDILNEGELAIEGSELNNMSDEALAQKVANISVYSRVAPEHKVRIVNAWKSKGHIVAMTGDGVNDAPALKTADIGASMGIVGTEVAKEAADMILTDDNFATIVLAIEEGRRIFDNILKAVYFLLSCNIGEIVTLFTATIFLKSFGGAEPLIAIQILWVNLVTDSLPALALGLEPAEEGIMKRKPLPFNSPIFTRNTFGVLLYQGITVGILTLLAYQIGYRTTGSVEVGQTMSFAVLSFTQLFHVFNLKSMKKSIFKINIFNNPKLLMAVGISVISMLGVLLLPPIKKLFKITSLTLTQWGIVIGLSASIILVVEIVKFLTRKRKRND